MSRHYSLRVRCLSVALTAAQVGLGVPISARAKVAPSAAIATTLPAVPLPAPAVAVNRTVPKVNAPAPVPVFSDRPSADEIFRARVFGEPLVPVGGAPSDKETAALAAAVAQFHRTGGINPRSAFGAFLATYPDSPWRASLMANIGVVEARQHAYTDAFEALEAAWQRARDLQDARGRAVADFAVGEWLELAVSFGQLEEVEARLASIADRPIAGAAGVKIARVRETAHLITRYPDRTRWCGPEALMAVLAERDATAVLPAALTTHRGSAKGMTLSELESLARRAGLSMRSVRWTPGAELPVPSVMHLRVGHYVAIVEVEAGRYRVIDRARGQEYWADREQLVSESSGYFLAEVATLPAGLVSASEEESAGIRGSGPICPDGASPPNPPCTPGECCPGGPGGGPPGGGPPGGCGGGKSCGMATYVFQGVSASLLLHDTPVGYTPVRGPAVPLAFGYHQRENLQPQIFSMANVGPKWTFTWLRFVQEVPMDVFGIMPAHVWVFQPPGGREVYSHPNAQGVFGAHWSSRAVLVRVSTNPLRYERRLPDGSVEVYAQADGAPAGRQRVFMTELIDPLGDRLQFMWDAQLRLVAITDAVGQVTTIEYESGDSLKITSVTDPFNRRAMLAYNAAGQLESITDVLGLVSRFTYGPNDFVSALTTPYGTTTFRHEPDQHSHYTLRYIEATDPLGGTERLMFEYETDSLPATAPAGEVASGFEAWNTHLNRYNTFYWDKRAWALHPDDRTKAVATHWLVAEEFQSWQKFSAPVPHSIKKPLEGRVWYAYPGQTAGKEDEAGWWREPSRVGRVLEDGSSQITQAIHNSAGSVLVQTDPLGRETTYTYGPDGVQLLEVRQTTGGINDLLASYSNFTPSLLPQTVTDAAGQSTTLTYNPVGQVLTTTNAKNETTTFGYDANGRLSSVTGPATGATTTYTYDAYGRARTVTDADNYTTTTDYDVFDRPIRVTYPDGTYEATTYDRLDVSTRRDRAGRITRYYYDALQRLVATRDPAGRTITQEWCPCGGLDALVDANGNRTRWERDLQGRVTRELRADGVTDTLYTYGPMSGRLLTVTDPKDQVTAYTYYLDDAIASVTYTNAQIPTPGVSYTYDPAYGRTATMVDGIGTTTYTYHPAGQLGAGQVASVDGPLTDDTITYTYDQLGRVVTRAINGAANTVTWSFDALGRITSEANVLGTFTYTYDGPTSRIATVTYPNGQASEYTYFDGLNDHRLQTIHHKYPGGATLSKFDYTYDAVGNILAWRQQADTTAVLLDYGYDAADQLVAAVKKATDPQQTVLQRYAYAYDPAGNRTAEQIDDQVMGASYDNLNRLVSQQPAGPLVFSGSVSEPSSVTVQGLQAVVGNDNTFKATVPLASGTSTVTVMATDSTGNVGTNQYEVDSLGTGRTFTYDANGNLTADGTRTFEWDARNQLIAVTEGAHRIEFGYDGKQHRVRVVERENGVVESDANVIWCQMDRCEERAANGVTVTRRTFVLAEEVAGTARFQTRDHQRTVWEVLDGAGTLLARHTYDPWGRRTLTQGATATDVGYTGHRAAVGELWFTLYRQFDPNTARWISEDPSGFRDGPNVYAYVRNDPITLRDELGLWAGGIGGGAGGAVAVGIIGGQVSADCSIVVDGTGNIGVLCCASAGVAYGLTVSGGVQVKIPICRSCTSICELEGPTISATVTAGPFGAEMGVIGGSGGAASVGFKPGLGPGAVGGTIGGCQLIKQRRPCDPCAPQK